MRAALGVHSCGAGSLREQLPCSSGGHAMDLVTSIACEVFWYLSLPVLCDCAPGRRFVTTRVRSDCGSSASPFGMCDVRRSRVQTVQEAEEGRHLV
jgi:hypothetical protein